MQRIFTRRKSGQYDDNNSADELYCMYITNLDIPIVGNVLGGEGISPPPLPDIYSFISHHGENYR